MEYKILAAKVMHAFPQHQTSSGLKRNISNNTISVGVMKRVFMLMESTYTFHLRLSESNSNHCMPWV